MLKAKFKYDTHFYGADRNAKFCTSYYNSFQVRTKNYIRNLGLGPKWDLIMKDFPFWTLSGGLTMRPIIVPNS